MAGHISDLITGSSSLPHNSWSKAASFFRIKKQNSFLQTKQHCFSATLGRRGSGSVLAASVPYVATWWRPQVQKRNQQAQPKATYHQSACKEALGTHNSLVLQIPCFVQVQPGPVLFFKQRKFHKGTAGKINFQASTKSVGPLQFEVLWLN